MKPKIYGIGFIIAMVLLLFTATVHATWSSELTWNLNMGFDGTQYGDFDSQTLSGTNRTIDDVSLYHRQSDNTLNATCVISNQAYDNYYCIASITADDYLHSTLDCNNANYTLHSIYAVAPTPAYFCLRNKEGNGGMRVNLTAYTSYTQIAKFYSWYKNESGQKLSYLHTNSPLYLGDDLNIYWDTIAFANYSVVNFTAPSSKKYVGIMTEPDSRDHSITIPTGMATEINETGIWSLNVTSCDNNLSTNCDSKTTAINFSINPSQINYTNVTMILYPIEDSYTDIQSPVTNYGNSTYLLTRDNGWYPNTENRQIFAKFNLSGLENVTDAKFFFTAVIDTAYYGNCNLQLYDCPNPACSWTESGITWNNQPSVITLLGSKSSFYPLATQTSNFSVTSWVQNNTNTISTLSIKTGCSGSDTFSYFFGSRDGNLNARPYLAVNQTLQNISYNCSIGSSTITSLCNGTCDVGENVQTRVVYSGTCPALIYVQTDAVSNDTLCGVEHSGGDMSGIYGNPCTASPCTFNWTVPSIPTDCIGKTIRPNATALWFGGYPPSAQFLDVTFNPSGAFTLTGTPSCPFGLTFCTDACYDLQSDTHNCGSCGVICGTNQTCQNGACTNTTCLGKTCTAWTNCTGSMVNGYWQQRNCTDSCDTYIEEMECPAGELQFLNPTNYSLNDTVGQINSIKNEYVVPIANFMPIIITLLAIFVFIALLIGVVSYSHHR